MSLVLKSKGLLAILMLSTLSSFANTNDDINAYRDEGLRIAASVSAESIDALKDKSARASIENRAHIDAFMKHARRSLPIKKQAQAVDGAILFVSFSMPEPLLFALADEAASFNIPVVINGLVEGDFKKTIETFTRLNRDAEKQHLHFKGVSIDPLWFQQFDIKAVPALVVSARPASCEAQTVCAAQTFDVVYGNATIKNGLELVASKGEASTMLARTILEQGHV